MRRYWGILMWSWWIPHLRVMVVLRVLVLVCSRVRVLVVGRQLLTTMKILSHCALSAVAPRLLLNGLWGVVGVDSRQSHQLLRLSLLWLLRKSEILGCSCVWVLRLLGACFFFFPGS